MEEETRKLGASDVIVPALGVGVWAWGEKGYWGYGTTYSQGDIQAAYKTCLDAGLNFFDTAEVYGNGESERLLGICTRSDPRPVLIASKFAPLPLRLAAGALRPALDATLQRLGRPQIDLYQVHWPYSFIKIEALMEVLAESVKAGKIRAVGVSNYNAQQMYRAHARLASYEIPLASNQVQYSLLKRNPETNGVLQACRDLNVAVIAYSPLAQGLLTEKYANPVNGQYPVPSGPRRFLPDYKESNLRKIEPIYQVLREIAQKREKTVEQVALNWLLCRDKLIVPIPGAKTARQAKSNAGALGWRLSEEEVAQLDLATNSRLH